MQTMSLPNSSFFTQFLGEETADQIMHLFKSFLDDTWTDVVIHDLHAQKVSTKEKEPVFAQYVKRRNTWFCFKFREKDSCILVLHTKKNTWCTIHIKINKLARIFRCLLQSKEHLLLETLYRKSIIDKEPYICANTPSKEEAILMEDFVDFMKCANDCHT